ncbi:2-C-methyl-D-erythritol 4-phosphate cytidylyltransferase [Thiorhodovibrio frisius]|uniref:2-C-methyl-D-erythritol 4-phosphate cytidylyltransferase n=1 Tax=Thiorhodovibrio frisius TaxID=631362 RepID=H8Z3D0_9GAMM|nr:2-C-methyl-D-erythritol 4-phosphate cytidylyltransferase [Thiorhodovibrio frisius]EIC21838.1 2-C-methyl-D-erythritol 4-phosphate cytidylyltransferase [Thiorhodovibrio frisius]WPL21806.1 2-C-methyl-D-erythritol 4-phosphate cytidylyltransferase [Thiorhodovibrio frisius]
MASVGQTARQSAQVAAACWVLIPAAGVGRRFGAARPKQYLELDGRRVIDRALDCFLEHSGIRGCVVVLHPDDPYWPEGPHADHPGVLRADGGAERCHSVRNGLDALAAVADEQDWVLVHDAARPCLRRADLDSLLAVLVREPVGALLAVPVHDTVKRANPEPAANAAAPGAVLTADVLPRTVSVAETVPRADLWRAFTPQAFRLGQLRQALDFAFAHDQLVTDDASAIELLGLSPRLVEGHSDNIKITRPEDLDLARFYLSQQAEQAKQTQPESAC